MLNHSIGTKAILLMGGSGERFGSTTPKQFHRLAGKKVYLHTLDTFLASALFEKIVLVCPEAWIEEVKSDLNAYPNAPVIITPGGATRQESSLLGLLACGEDTRLVVIHDAVRPFVSTDILKDNVAGARLHGAVDTCIPSADTLVHAPTKKEISSIPHRAEFQRGQTPQSFAYPLILEAHHMALQSGITATSDDCTLALKAGHPVHIVTGSEENIKITSELDLFLAEQILRLKHTPIYPEGEAHCLLGKRIAITGGTGGIGSALCELLEQEGAIPIVLSRSSTSYPADLTSFGQAERTFNQILADHGELDALVNSIGLLKHRELAQLKPAEIDDLIATNLTGVLYSCKCAHLKKGAHIINIASSSYARGRKNYAIYTGAKAAIVNFTQGLAEEREDLCVNALIPQRTQTAMRLDNFPDEDPSTLLTPHEVAKEILSLLKQQTLTGTLVDVRKK